MRRKNTKKGFTLLELLVVVVIIGILTAIALPQYNKVKVKARTRQFILSLKAINEAQQRFYLVNNRYANSFSDLDIEIEGYPGKDCSLFSSFGPRDCLSNNYSVLFLNRNSNCFALFNTGKYALSRFEGVKDKILCYDAGNNKLCTEVLNCNLYDSSLNYNFYYTCPNL